MEVGAIQVPLNPQSTEAELRGFVEQVAPAAIVTDGALADAVDAAAVADRRAATGTVASTSTSSSRPSPTATARPTSIRATWR